MSESDCLFCKIAHNQLPAQKVWEDPQTVAFLDIHPQAPIHIVLIPKKHIVSVAQTQDEDQPLLGGLILTARRIAKDKGLEDPGYRLVVNTGEGGGQTVYHLHIHILGGRPMKWPPG